MDNGNQSSRPTRGELWDTLYAAKWYLAGMRTAEAEHVLPEAGKDILQQCHDLCEREEAWEHAEKEARRALPA